MARAASAPKKEISMEEALWKSADKLRGSVEPAEYKHVVLSLFFLKFASDKFEAQRKAISEKYGEKFVDNVAFYTKDNVCLLYTSHSIPGCGIRRSTGIGSRRGRSSGAGNAGTRQRTCQRVRLDVYKRQDQLRADGGDETRDVRVLQRLLQACAG